MSSSFQIVSFDCIKVVTINFCNIIPGEFTLFFILHPNTACCFVKDVILFKKTSTGFVGKSTKEKYKFILFKEWLFKTYSYWPDRENGFAILIFRITKEVVWGQFVCYGIKFMSFHFQPTSALNFFGELPL